MDIGWIAFWVAVVILCLGALLYLARYLQSRNGK